MTEKLKAIPTKFPYVNRFGMIYEKRHIDMITDELRRVSRDNLKIAVSLLKHINYFNPTEVEEDLEKHMLWFARMILRRESTRLDKKSEHFSNVIEKFGKSEIEIETIPSMRPLDDIEGMAISEDFIRHVEKSCGQFAKDTLDLLIDGHSNSSIAKILKSSRGTVGKTSETIRRLANRYFYGR